MRPLNLLFPPKCILCGTLLEKGEVDLCEACREEAPAYNRTTGKLPFLKGWTALWYYEDAVRRSLLRYKFYGTRVYAHGYGRLLAEKLAREYPEGFDLITWVPISGLRKLRRGFDQSKLLAQCLCREWDRKPQKLLKKIRHNKVQSGISGVAHRRANVMGVYQVTDPALLTGKRILLVDDIITTGATAGECARMLLTAGAKEVICAAVACAHRER